MNNNNSLGKKLKQARKELKLTQKKLAGDFITRNMLSQIENGQANPSIKTIEYLARKLNKPISYFLDDDYSKNLTPTNNNEHINNSILLYKEQKYKQCIDSINKTIESLEKNEILENILWFCYIKLGIEKYYNKKFLEAKLLILKAYDYENNLIFIDKMLKANSLIIITKILLYNNEVELANNYFSKYEELIENNYKFDENLYLKCELMIKNRKFEDCKNYLIENTSKKIKSSFRYNFTLAIIYYENNYFYKALELFEKAYESKENLNELESLSITKYFELCLSKITINKENELLINKTKNILSKLNSLKKTI